MKQELPEILTAAEAAKFLRLSVNTLRNEAFLGHIPGVKIGDSWRFLRKALEDHVAGRAQNNGN